MSFHPQLVPRGLDIEVDPDNQWLVAFRIGRDPSLDYKHGYSGTPSQDLGDDLPPDNDSAGWALGSYEEFYDSDIIYYLLTEE